MRNSDRFREAHSFESTAPDFGLAASQRRLCATYARFYERLAEREAAQGSDHPYRREAMGWKTRRRQ
jgi:hypothetical protein